MTYFNADHTISLIIGAAAIANAIMAIRLARRASARADRASELADRASSLASRINERSVSRASSSLNFIQATAASLVEPVYSGNLDRTYQTPCDSNDSNKDAFIAGSLIIAPPLTSVMGVCPGDDVIRDWRIVEWSDSGAR